MKRALVLVLVFLAGIGGSAQAADQVIFVVRHAERADQGAAPMPPTAQGMIPNDPSLSEAGTARAAKLAALLASADVKHIFTTEFKRTRETAAPLAGKLKVDAVMSASRDPQPLIDAVRKTTGNVLIVGHSNTVPDLLKRLGLKETIAIAENEYDNLFILVRRDAGDPTLIRLRY
jgi:broad specificity phosphatase PhoE